MAIVGSLPQWEGEFRILSGELKMKDTLLIAVCPFFMAMNYYVYILRSTIKETYYYGSSEDPDRRLPHHNGESKGYTQRYRPWTIVFRHKFDIR